MASSKPYPRQAFHGAYHFSVEINGVTGAFFRSVSGLKSEAEVVIVQEGGVNTVERKLIGRTKNPNLVMKQGFANLSLYDKRMDSVDDGGKALPRFNGTIRQLGPGGSVVHSWQFSRGWICKWEGPDLDAAKNEISVESIEIAYEGLEYIPGSSG